MIKINDKFKIGDIVVVTNIDVDNGDDIEYSEFKGNLGQVIKINKTGSYPYMLKLLKGNNETESGAEFDSTGWNSKEITLVKNISWKKMLKNDT